MPIRITETAGDTAYADPFTDAFGPMHVKVDVSVLTTAEVDVDGYLKPGVPFAISAGLAVLVGAATAVVGVTREATKIADTNTALASNTSDPLITIMTHGVINRDLAEDNLGRAYNANELAGFDLAGSHIRLTTT